MYRWNIISTYILFFMTNMNTRSKDKNNFLSHSHLDNGQLNLSKDELDGLSNDLLYITWCERKGFCVRARQDLQKGTAICWYHGEKIDEIECQKRLHEMDESRLSKLFFIEKGKKSYYIDVKNSSGIGQYMNHICLCLANCAPKLCRLKNDKREEIVFFAKREILSNEELVWTYNKVPLKGSDHFDWRKCQCDQKNRQMTCFLFCMCAANEIEPVSFKQTREEAQAKPIFLKGFNSPNEKKRDFPIFLKGFNEERQAYPLENVFLKGFNASSSKTAKPINWAIQHPGEYVEKFVEDEPLEESKNSDLIEHISEPCISFTDESDCDQTNSSFKQSFIRQMFSEIEATDQMRMATKFQGGCITITQMLVKKFSMENKVDYERLIHSDEPDFYLEELDEHKRNELSNFNNDWRKLVDEDIFADVDISVFRYLAMNIEEDLSYQWPPSGYKACKCIACYPELFEEQRRRSECPEIEHEQGENPEMVNPKDHDDISIVSETISIVSEKMNHVCLPSKLPKRELQISSIIEQIDEEDKFFWDLIKEEFKKMAISVSDPVKILEIADFKGLLIGDLLTLAEGSWLNGAVIDACLSMFTYQKPNICYIQTNEVKHFKKHGKISKKWPWELEGKKKIFIPLYLPAHWAMAIVDLNANIIKILDSMYSKDDPAKENLLTIISSMLEQIAKEQQFQGNIPTAFREIENLPSQSNTDDCGVHSLLYAMFKTEDRPISFHSTEIPSYRKKFFLDLCKASITYVDHEVKLNLPNVLPLEEQAEEKRAETEGQKVDARAQRGLDYARRWIKHSDFQKYQKNV